MERSKRGRSGRKQRTELQRMDEGCEDGGRTWDREKKRVDPKKIVEQDQRRVGWKDHASRKGQQGKESNRKIPEQGRRLNGKPEEGRNNLTRAVGKALSERGL